MTKIYHWTTDDDELADNAIIVSIGGTDTNVVVNYGLSHFPPGASLVWLAMFTHVGFFEEGWEDCFETIPEALARAEVLKEQMGADRVVVSIQEYGILRDEGGQLPRRRGWADVWTLHQRADMVGYPSALQALRQDVPDQSNVQPRLNIAPTQEVQRSKKPLKPISGGFQNSFGAQGVVVRRRTVATLPNVSIAVCSKGIPFGRQTNADGETDAFRQDQPSGQQDGD